MRILLDECMPASLAREFSGHEVFTAPKMGWAGFKNGALLGRAVEGRFEVFLTRPQRSAPSLPWPASSR